MILKKILFNAFWALILRNREFSLTYNDYDTLLYELGTLIKAVKSSGPNWNFKVVKPFLSSQISSRPLTVKCSRHKFNQSNQKKTRCCRCFEFQLGRVCKAFQTMSCAWLYLRGWTLAPKGVGWFKRSGGFAVCKPGFIIIACYMLGSLGNNGKSTKQKQRHGFTNQKGTNLQESLQRKLIIPMRLTEEDQQNENQWWWWWWRIWTVRE